MRTRNGAQVVREAREQTENRNESNSKCTRKCFFNNTCVVLLLLLLLCVWGDSARITVIIRNILYRNIKRKRFYRFSISEMLFFFFGKTRFVQYLILYRNMYNLRSSSYWTLTTVTFFFYFLTLGVRQLVLCYIGAVTDSKQS